MDTRKTKEILEEIKETVDILDKNIEDAERTKFFIGKLHFLTIAFMEAYANSN